MKIKEENKIEEKTYTVENTKNTFLIVENENEDEEDKENFGFHDLSFKEIYMNDDLLSHVITHLNSFLSMSRINSIRSGCSSIISIISNFNIG